MNLRRSLIPLFCKVGAVSLALGGGAFAQGLDELIAQSNAAMDGNRWEQALALNERAIERFGKAAMRRYGAQFGAVYYRKGLCEMKLKRWQQAMGAFEICYRDFPNEGGKRDNPFQTMALLKWGEAAMGAEAWEVAASRFAKFTDERDRKTDKFPQGAFYINLAICQYKVGRIYEGNENLEIAMGNRLDFPTPDAGIVAAFQAQVEGVIAKRDEQALMDFIGRNRGELIVEPAEMRRYSGMLLKLAGDALASGMQRAAIALYQFVPSEEADLAGPSAPEIVKLAAVALIHEKNGNVRGAFAAYQQLVLGFPQAAGREEYFYHLVRTASLIGDEGLTGLYAAGFLEEFPKSPHLAEIGAVLLEGEEFPPALKPCSAEPAAAALPATREFAGALDLYQGRKYQDAKAAFEEIKSSAAESPNSDAFAFAAFYETECLRKLGDLESLSRELKTQPRPASLGGYRLRQLDIDALWDAVRTKNWERAGQLAKERGGEILPGDQRVQVACCHGLALENLGRTSEALIAYDTALTADAGASEDVVRQAAIGILRILQSDPEVQAAIAKWGTDEPKRTGAGFFKLKEAAAVAALFELSLGAGMPLPADFKGFLRFRD